MDPDVQEHLREVAKNVHSVARLIESPKADIKRLEDISECLRTSAETVDTYIRILKLRQE